MKKTISVLLIFIAVCLCFAYFVLPPVIIGGRFAAKKTYDDIADIYRKNQTELSVIVQYIAENKFDDFYMSDLGSEKFSANGEKLTLTDENVLKSLRKLKVKHCSVITKENNTMAFEFWSNLDSGSGIAYSMDGAEIYSQFLVSSKKLNDKGWYYYLDDVNRWKSEHKK